MRPPAPFEAGIGWLFIPCLVCIWLVCQGVLQQALHTSFEAIVLRYDLIQGLSKLTMTRQCALITKSQQYLILH